MIDEKLRLLIIGAHPDDAEYYAGGLAVLYRRFGHPVKAISVTDGAAGHHERPSDELACLRTKEAAAAGEIIGAPYETWEFPDGGLFPTIELREAIIREIRTYRPDLVVTHRCVDYHPDHRATGQAVQDACYMVTVPLVCPDTPPLRHTPVVAFMADLFTKPVPFSPDVALDITALMDVIVSMLACHRSQVFEWLPYSIGRLDEVPDTEDEKIAWLRASFEAQIAPRANRFRETLVQAYGPENGGKIRCAEFYEISEHGGECDEETLRRLFPNALPIRHA
jgi:LmbE family N-acetylglucosaminyl deacetylase